MSKFCFSNASIGRLEGVHADLMRVMFEAIEQTPLDFGITEGRRSVKRQKELVAKGASKTMNSRHLSGHAVDIAVYVDGKITWDFEKYTEVAAHIKAVAANMKIPIKWGGDWKTFKDGPHFELDKEVYPS